MFASASTFHKYHEVLLSLTLSHQAAKLLAQLQGEIQSLKETHMLQILGTAKCRKTLSKPMTPFQRWSWCARTTGFAPKAFSVFHTISFASLAFSLPQDPILSFFSLILLWSTEWLQPQVMMTLQLHHL